MVSWPGWWKPTACHQAVRVSFLCVVMLRGLRIHVMKMDNISISKRKALCVSTGQLEVAYIVSLMTLAMFSKLPWLPASVVLH